MLSEPKTEYRKLLPYLAIPRTVAMNDISQVLPPLIPQIKQWMIENNVPIGGPDFFLYKSMNDQGELECEVGFPVTDSTEGENPIISGSFPEGLYASIIYTGDFKGMMDGHKALEKWIKEQGLKEKVQTDHGTTRWGGRTEFYLVDPDHEPDPSKWQTEIVFLLEG